MKYEFNLAAVSAHAKELRPTDALLFALAERLERIATLLERIADTAEEITRRK